MILCLGTTPTVQRSMTFNELVIDDVNRAVEVSEYASGKSPNVARVLKTMGADAMEVGFAGGDRGRFLLQDLEKAGIRCDFVSVPEQTRLCTTVIDRSIGIATELVEEHAPVSQASWDEMDAKLRQLLPLASTWIFSGSLPPGAPQDFYARWVPLARQQGARLILDARGLPLKLALSHGGFIAKLNRDELAATVGRPLDEGAELIQAVRDAVPVGGAIIITLGAVGALASDGETFWRLMAPKVKAVSAVGSGDAFAAGLALGLERGQTLPEAMALGSACGAANALTDRAGHLNPADVERLRKNVVVKEVAT